MRSSTSKAANLVATDMAASAARLSGVEDRPMRPMPASRLVGNAAPAVGRGAVPVPHAMTQASGDAAAEYKRVCEFMRQYATLRFCQLALQLGTTGSIVTALSSTAVREAFVRAELLKMRGLMVSFAFLVMEYRATSYWHRLRNRGNALAVELRFEPFPVISRWNPLTTSGVSFCLHAAVAALWLVSLFLTLRPDA